MEESTYGSNGTASGSPKNTSETTSRSGRPSVHEETVYEYMEGVLKSQGRIATFNEAVQATHLPESTVSRLRNSWLQQPHNPVKPKEVFHVKPEASIPVPEVKVASNVSRETKGGYMTVLDHWNNFKRILLVICAVLMWVMSIVFSYIGFKADVQTEWYFGIFALILSATITSLELYLNSQTFDFNEVDMGLVILWIGGFAAYAYGIWTNVVGVGEMMLGGDLVTVKWSAQVVPIIVGILLEVLPEPMFVAFLKTKAVKRPNNQQQQKQRIPIPPPNTIKQANTVYPRMDPDVLASLQKTHPYRPVEASKR